MTTKVLHLISGGDTGGAKTHIFSLMKGLKGLAQTKIICFIDDTFYKDALEQGIDIELYPQKSRSDMSVVKKIADLVNKEGYDLVHCHGARANTIAIFLKRKIMVPMITTIHSDYLLDFKDTFYKDLIFTPINTFALKNFDYYVAVTENFKNMLISRGFTENKIYTLYNGIEMEMPKKLLTKEEFLNKYGLADLAKGKFLIGQAARLDNVKNVQMTIKTVKKIRELREDFLVLIAGRGEEDQKLKDMVKEYGLEENVAFLGFVKDNLSFFNAIDLNLLTSLSESFPYVILEAAKMGKASIATSVGGLGEMIRYGVDGYLVEVNDYKSLAEKIQVLMDNPDILEKFGASINARVNESFSSQAMAKTQAQIYEDILRRTQNGKRVR
ncbi:MAG: glycosyltransferase family 4 protein [Bacillota bacterium]|nr:glycosyltransferase family 4 protein [Bacillota bacterium]